MEIVGKHGLHGDLDQNQTTTLPKCKAQFLDAQVTGAAFMLQRTCGGIPVSRERANQPEVALACSELQSIRTFGGYVVDVTGFGKTETSLLFASI